MAGVSTVHTWLQINRCDKESYRQNDTVTRAACRHSGTLLPQHQFLRTLPGPPSGTTSHAATHSCTHRVRNCTYRSWKVTENIPNGCRFLGPLHSFWLNKEQFYKINLVTVYLQVWFETFCHYIQKWSMSICVRQSHLFNIHSIKRY